MIHLLIYNPATAHIDEKARDFITKAHKSARHLGKLFQDLLDISKSEDGRLKNEPKVIDVNEFVKEIFGGLAQKAAEKKLDYIFNPAAKINDDGSEKSLQPIFYANVDLQVILSGRHVNNAMASFIASKVMKLMINKGLAIKDSNRRQIGRASCRERV